MFGPVRGVGALRSQRRGRRSRVARSGTPEPAGTPLPAHPRAFGPVTCARTPIGRVLLRNAANHWISMSGIIPGQGMFTSVSAGHRNALIRLHTAEVWFDPCSAHHEKPPGQRELFLPVRLLPGRVLSAGLEWARGWSSRSASDKRCVGHAPGVMGWVQPRISMGPGGTIPASRRVRSPRG